jgi:hypothetical protein
VIITRFPTTGEGGHGHHTASAILASEAFTAAADRNRFPDQFQYGLEPWQPKRLLWNTFNFGGNNQTREDQLKIDVGGYNPVLGKSYGEIAAESRSQHRSQGFGVPRQRGTAIEYFTTLAGEPAVNDLMDGVNTTWGRIEGAAKIASQIDQIIESYKIAQPEKSIEPLIALYKSVNQLKQNDIVDEKLPLIQTLIEQCAGLFIEASTPQQFAAIGDSLLINVTVVNRGTANLSGIKLTNSRLHDKISFDTITPNKLLTKSYKIKIGEGTQPSQPYWLTASMDRAAFQVGNNYNIGLPQNTTDTLRFIYTINDLPLVTHRSIFYKYTDPVMGEQLQPVIVTPRIIVTLQPNVVLTNVVPRVEPFLKITYQGFFNQEKVPVSLHIKQNAGLDLLETDTEMNFVNSGINSIQIPLKPFVKTLNQNNIKELTAEIKIPRTVFNKVPENTKTSNPPGTFIIQGDGKVTYSKGLKIIKYEHIPNINYFYTDRVTVVNEEIKTTGKKIGYIVGAGDYVPEALEQMGYEVTLLNDKGLAGKLQQFDAIITGVRAYNTNDWMSRHYQKLMKYVENGGNLIVQYNTSNQLGSVRGRIGPYDFNITRTRVSDEKAPVTFLVTNHPVLNYPNKITADDFKDWVQERSIYHAAASDNNFQKILLMGDPGEKPDEGSLIISKYGKGYFTYTGLVFFRQLPAGNPGAFRLMANIIALNQQQKQF